MDPVLFYGAGNQHGHFSNFAKFPIVIADKTFLCNEQFIMYSKAKLFPSETNDQIAAKIMATKDPNVMKRLGRTIVGFDQDVWDREVERIANACNLAKFTQHPKLKEELLATGSRVIAEASANDRIWGIGVDWEVGKDVRTWNGQNLLGKSLMYMRALLKFPQP